MYIERLELSFYRNIRESAVDFCRNVNLFYGENAQGKTNLLEAIWLCSSGKSFRGGNDRDFVTFRHERARICLRFHAAGRSFDAKLEMSQKGRRSMYINDVQIRKTADFISHLHCVIFTPEHLTLVKEGPGERRRFLDTALCSLFPRYMSTLIKYNRIVGQKNALLKDAARFPQLLETLPVWNAKLCEAAGTICAMRQKYIRRLAGYAADLHSQLGGGERLSLRYLPSFEGACPENPAEAAAAVEAAIDQQAELCAGASLTGPHRDDLEILINDRPARIFGSQGQQRSAVLSMKLAEGRLAQDIRGEPPVLLLDDVLSELDSRRREFVMRHIEGHQVIITSCENDRPGLVSGRTFLVSEGAIIPQTNR